MVGRWSVRKGVAYEGKKEERMWLSPLEKKGTHLSSFLSFFLWCRCIVFRFSPSLPPSYFCAVASFFLLFFPPFSPIKKSLPNRLERKRVTGRATSDHKIGKKERVGFLVPPPETKGLLCSSFFFVTAAANKPSSCGLVPIIPGPPSECD